MGQAKLRGTYEQRKANPKQAPREAAKPATVLPASFLLAHVLSMRSKVVRVFSKKGQRKALADAAFRERKQRRKAKEATAKPANPIPLPERQLPPMASEAESA